MLPSLFWRVAFWDALLVFLWLLLFALAVLVVLTSQMGIQWAPAAPMITAAFVWVSASRFLALRTGSRYWVAYLLFAQVPATMTLLSWRGVGAPHQLVEDALAGSAAALLLYAAIYWIRPRRHPRGEHIRELMEARMQRGEPQTSKL